MDETRRSGVETKDVLMYRQIIDFIYAIFERYAVVDSFNKIPHPTQLVVPHKFKINARNWKSGDRLMLPYVPIDLSDETESIMPAVDDLIEKGQAFLAEVKTGDESNVGKMIVFEKWPLSDSKF